MEPRAAELRNVSVMRGGRRILDGVSLDVGYGENIAVIGANGSGKTTLVKLFSGDILPYYEEDGSSSIRLFGEERWSIFELRSRIGIVSMDLQTRFGPETLVSEVILSGYFGSLDVFRNHEVTEDMLRAVRNAAVRMGMEDKLDRPIGGLSLGEMRRALIARALAPEPGMLILDEPMTGLDIVMKGRFRRMFDILSASGIGIVMITHELEDIPASVRRVVMIKDGRKVADGLKEKVLTSVNLSYLFDAPIDVVCSGGVYRMSLRDE